MSTDHRGGNIQNEITLEEHDGTLNAKRVSVASTPTIYAVVNTAAAGDSVNNIGFATVAVSTPTLYAVVNTAAAGQASVALDNSLSKIGFATVHVGTPTLYAVVNTSAPGVGNSIVTIANTPLSTQIIGNVTLSGPLPTGANYIGLVSVQGKVIVTDGAGNDMEYAKENDNWSAADHGIIMFARDVDTSPSKYRSVQTDANGHLKVVLDALPTGLNNIGFATVNQVNQPALVASNANIGSVSILGGGIGINTGLNNIGFATVAVSTPTLYAVVNTAAAGQASVVLDTGTSWIGIATVWQASSARTITGNLTLTDSKSFIGLVTVGGGVLNTITAVTDITNPVAIKGNLTLSDSKAFIGLTTSVIGSAPTIFAVVNTAAAGQASVVLDNSIANIGFATVSVSNLARTITGNLTLSDAKTYIGLVSVSGTVGLAAGVAGIGFATVNLVNSVGIAGNLTLSDSKTFIGLTTTTLGASPAFVGIMTVTNRDRTITGNLTLSDAKTYIGLVSISGTAAIAGNLTLTDSKGFIGLVTANSLNAGTTKALISRPVGLGQNSLATVAVPTNAQKINVTQLVLNSNVTTEIAIKSGVTYLTGNASLGITLFPGGGFVMNGSPDSPVWISLPSGAIVVEKRDPGGTTSKIGGGLIYFDE